MSGSGKTSLKPFPRERFLQFCGSAQILTRDFGLIPFKLLGSQLFILDEICKGMDEGIANYIILKSRQLGSSTLFVLLDMFWCFEYPGISGAIITHTEQLRDQFKNMIAVNIAHLPKGYKVSARRDNRNMIQFENGSVMQFFVAGTKETSKGFLGTGSALNYLHKSEESAYGSPDDLKNLQASLSTRYPHRLYINETTARGFNHFADTWESARDSSISRVIFVGWWRNELFRFDRDSMEYGAYWQENEKPNPLERKRMKIVFDSYGVEVQPEQMAWYRSVLNEPPYNGDQAKMDEDFPWTPDEAFVSTGSRFFTNDSITDQMRRARGRQLMPYKYQLGYDWRDTKLIPSSPARADLRIWEEANPIGRYIVSCDPAYGSSDEADRTAISVVRAYADRCVQVAEFCSPIVSTSQCAWILAHLCGYYGNVRMIMEIQGPGQVVDKELDTLRRTTHQMFAPEDKLLRNALSGIQAFLFRRGDSYAGTVQKQFKTSRELKSRMMNHLKDSLELDRLIVYSQAALEECKTIIYDDGSIAAEKGKKDDRVIALGMANFAWGQWEQGPLRQQGMTMLRAAEIQEKGMTQGYQNERIVLNYLEGAGMLKKPDSSNTTVLPLARPYGR